MRKLVLFALVAGLGCGTAARSETNGDAGPATESASAGPVIASIRLEGTNVVILARVPAGMTKVTLESCRRLRGESWTPRAVGRLNSAGGELTFRLAQSPDFGLGEQERIFQKGHESAALQIQHRD